MTHSLQTLLANHPLVISDGAMATELEKLGVQTDNDLWSAMALISDQEAIRQVHRSYFAAGANIATTNTYQSNVQAFEKYGLHASKGEELIKAAVKIAQAARTNPTHQLVAGSVGPYGAYLADGSEYTGNYHLTAVEYQSFHRPRIRALQEAGVDFLALETMPNFAECQALTELIHTEFSQMEAWLSWSIADTADQLWDGTPLAKAAKWASQQSNLVAIGVNCTRMENITPALQTLQTNTAKPLVVYPNNGDIYNPTTKTWQSVEDAHSIGDFVQEWVAAGASIIGGCCRTTPLDIQRVASFS